MPSDCHLMVFGGAPLDGPRRINWNFVASDPAVIEQARQRWAAGDWPTVPGSQKESSCLLNSIREQARSTFRPVNAVKCGSELLANRPNRRRSISP